MIILFLLALIVISWTTRLITIATKAARAFLANSDAVTAVELAPAFGVG